jgi:hypothetical protein
MSKNDSVALLAGVIVGRNGRAIFFWSRSLKPFRDRSSNYESGHCYNFGEFMPFHSQKADL